MTSEDADFLNETMCECSGTTRGDIITLFAQGKDMEAISRWTGALSGCGGGEWDIAELLREMAEIQASTPPATDC